MASLDEQVFSDLRGLVHPGFGHPHLRLKALPHLAVVGKEVAGDDEDAAEDAVKAFVRLALGELGDGPAADALLVLFKLDPATAGCNARERRKKAATKVGYYSVEGFRSHREKLLLRQLTKTILRLERVELKHQAAPAYSQPVTPRPQQTLSPDLIQRLTEERLTSFHFSRDDYKQRLGNYLASADQSIRVVSISLKVTDDENDLIELFRNRLEQRRDFQLIISLMDPDSAAAQFAADALNVAYEDLKHEISIMVGRLLSLKKRLPSQPATRMKVLLHDSFPGGSAILLDACEHGGRIQVETKLHRAARAHSFGFEITGPSPFFFRNLAGWELIIKESKPAREGRFATYLSC